MLTREDYWEQENGIPIRIMYMTHSHLNNAIHRAKKEGLKALLVEDTFLFDFYKNWSFIFETEIVFRDKLFELQIRNAPKLTFYN